MRVPLSWLADYVALPEDSTAAQVAADLVKVGLEEEAIHGGDITGPIVVGRVVDFVEEAQKNGKTIRWCQVDVGEEQPRGVICGARNFAAGDLVVVSLPGAVLPGGFAITARKTYGHVSDGMICSVTELGMGDDHSGILRLAELGLDDAAPGTDAIALLGLAEQTVEVNVTPDRGYAFSVRGVAREYSHSTGAVFGDPANIPVLPTVSDGFAVQLRDGAPIRGTQGCDRYVAAVVRNVNAAAVSPRWLQRRLDQAGMRPINLAVDVTNYVMLALGQPLHAFDLDGLQEPIVVRRATAGEHLVTLDDVDRPLDEQDLLITDADGQRILALAGVMGGASSEVTPQTRNLLIESAHFDPITVARSARRHKLGTEASRRFERGVDTDVADRAAALVVQLLVEYGGGEAVQVGPVTDVDERQATEPIALPTDLPSRIVGVDYTPAQVIQTLTTIGCTVESGAPGGESASSQTAGKAASGDVTETSGPGSVGAAGESTSKVGADAGAGVLQVRVPSWRPDLRAPIDLVEEVARLRGYDQIGSVLPTAPAGRGLTEQQRARRSVARSLAEHGLVEVLSYPFISAAVHDDFGLPADDARRRAVQVANPMSQDQPLLRTSILDSLVDVVRRNVSRGNTDLAVFEIGLAANPGGGWDPAAGFSGDVRQRPTDAQLRQLAELVPPQPRHVAIMLAGQRELPGWYGQGRAAQWSDAVQAAHQVGAAVGVELAVRSAAAAPWHPGRCAAIVLPDGTVAGHAGQLHPKVVAALGLPEGTCAAELDLDAVIAASGTIHRAQPVSSFGVVKEDVALIVAQDVPAAEVAAALRDGGGELLESVRLFDVYTGSPLQDGQKSLAFALRMRAPDRTLTAADSTTTRESAVAAASHRTGAVLRG